MKITEKEKELMLTVFDKLFQTDYSDLNKIFGSVTIKEIRDLYLKLYYNGYCERHGIKFEDMTEDDFEEADFEALMEDVDFRKYMGVR